MIFRSICFLLAVTVLKYHRTETSTGGSFSVWRRSLRRECPPSFFTDILTCPLFHCCCSWNHTMTHNDRGWGNQRTLLCRLFCIFPRVQLHFSARKCVKSISPNVSLTFYKHTGSLSWHLRKMYTYLEQNWIQNTKTWPSLRIITNVI